MSTYRQQAIEDVALATGRECYQVEAIAGTMHTDLGRITTYAMAQRERVIEQAAEILKLEAKLEQACDQLNAAMIGQRERQEQFEKMADLCDQAIEQRDGLSVQVARLKAPVSDEEWLRNSFPCKGEHIGKYIAERVDIDDIIAARAKEGK